MGLEHLPAAIGWVTAMSLTVFVSAAATDAAFVYAGQVVDERGKPVAGAKVTATHRHLHGARGGFGYIDVVQTDGEGRFAIERKEALSGVSPSRLGDDVIRIEFKHPDYLYGRVEDLRLFTPEQCRNLSVRLSDGRSLKGRVIDAAEKGVAGAMVDATFGEDFEYRKATLTDREGNFSLRGLPHVTGTLNVLGNDAQSPPQSGRLELAVARWDEHHLQIRVEPIVLPPDTVIHELLGMKLVDLTEPLRQAFHLSSGEGVLILDPGADPKRLQIGDIRRGDRFWIVGNQKVRNVAEFKAQLLNAGSGSPEEGYACRVVYEFSRPDSSGTNTQYLRFGEQVLAELRDTPHKR